MNKHLPNISRRQLLAASASLLGVGLAGSSARAWAQDQAPGQGRLVIVFLRGAYDGLSAFVPYGDAEYYRIRSSIAIAPPEKASAKGDDAVVRLDNLFGLHPALAGLKPLWDQGVLGFIPTAGNPDTTRSHFDAQHQWEIGRPGYSGASSGILNTLAQILGATKDESQSTAIGVGEANPAILAGDAAVRLIPSGQAATRTGALANDRARNALMDLYSGNDALSERFRQGSASRMDSAEQLNQATMSGKTAEQRMDNNAGNNGAGAASGLLLDAQHLGTLMRNEPRLRLGFLSAGGWDTHFNQGAATGALANNFKMLSATLLQLRKDFSQKGDVVVVMSEFGRTAAENGTRGSDHGHGNAMWFMGDSINGGRWHGQWAGLSRSALNESRDLPVMVDFRAALLPILQNSFALKENTLTRVFPGFDLNKAFRDHIRHA